MVKNNNQDNGMPLVPVRQLMESARQGSYAVGYFESWSIDSLQGVIDAAEEMRAPIIIGFNGEFMSSPERRAAERLSWYGALGVSAARSASVPCALIFNECGHDDWLKQAVHEGFNLIMPSDPAAPAERYRTWVANLVRYAHKYGVAVEAEVGTLPCGTNEGAPGTSSTTTPEQAAEFVAATGIDLLAVSVGNIHIKLAGSADLDLANLESIRRRVDCPFVLHGGTGISSASVRAAISLGVRKVNYGTYLKQRYLAALRAALCSEVANPHELLGIGGDPDLMIQGRRAIRDAVLERIDLLGCCGRA